MARRYYHVCRESGRAILLFTLPVSEAGRPAPAATPRNPRLRVSDKGKARPADFFKEMS